jgi:hypothetical protein
MVFIRSLDLYTFVRHILLLAVSCDLFSRSMVTRVCHNSIKPILLALTAFYLFALFWSNQKYNSNMVLAIIF